MQRKFSRATGIIGLMVFCVLSIEGCSPAKERVTVKVVVMAMFERGETRGDAPGELQLWVERLGLDTEYEFALGEDVLYMNDDGVMAVLLGRGIPNAAASVMALGLDDRLGARFPTIGRTAWCRWAWMHRPPIPKTFTAAGHMTRSHFRSTCSWLTGHMR
jgi:purine nucleoside permease